MLWDEARVAERTIYCQWWCSTGSYSRMLYAAICCTLHVMLAGSGGSIGHITIQW
jgi:hypothetical protein